MAYSVTTKKTWARILDDIEDSLGKWGHVALGWRVDTLLAPRSASKTYQSIEERTVTLHWVRKGKPYAIAMQKQARAVDNLLVIWLILETLRLNDARGYAEQIATVYRQEFPALPGPGQTGASVPPKPTPAGPGAVDPYAVLYVRRDAPLVICEAAYRAMAKAWHPDHSGRGDWIVAANVAIAAIRKEKG